METQKFCDKLLYIVLQSLLIKTIKNFCCYFPFKNTCMLCKQLVQVVSSFINIFLCYRKVRKVGKPTNAYINRGGSFLFVYIYFQRETYTDIVKKMWL